ncbi:hypothetical protein CVIRNUC_008487 [Coccomyxa viridis]|uniref:SnoaL-like domain-containing protein n=1 Tax=Coccomyxa viridis TaxID=1274662 RepID=A0AAV1ID33_9CHLO|nr:hypothetical protein CVIRNUC_008487 [Coccomyxa viridis]
MTCMGSAQSRAISRLILTGTSLSTMWSVEQWMSHLMWPSPCTRTRCWCMSPAVSQRIQLQHKAGGQNVQPKMTAHPGQHLKQQAKPSETIGVFHLRFNEKEMVQEIYFLRQLSHDEAARKMQKIPDLEKLDLKDITSYGGAMEHGEERAKKHDKAASLYNHIWASGDVSHADDIMASNVKMHSLIEGNSMSGVDTFKSMVSNIFKEEYEVKDNKSTVAVTAGNKAFIFWRVTGIYKGDWSQVYGLSFLVFNTEDKIEEVLTLMQPFPAQRRGLLKREE